MPEKVAIKLGTYLFMSRLQTSFFRRVNPKQICSLIGAAGARYRPIDFET